MMFSGQDITLRDELTPKSARGPSLPGVCRTAAALVLSLSAAVSSSFGEPPVIAAEHAATTGSEVPVEVAYTLVDHVAALQHVLQDGWDGYRAPPPNQLAVKAAIWVAMAAEDLGLEPVDVSASVEGGVCFSFEGGRHYVAIECDNDGQITVGESDGRGGHSAWMVTPSRDAIAEALTKVANTVS